MKRTTSRRRSGLPESLYRQLNAYALAASAAGVGVLALAPSAQARIVYTKTHQLIGANGIYAMDLNHDGTADFLVSQFTYNTTIAHVWLRAKPAVGNAVIGATVQSCGFHFASALDRGVRIGDGQHFLSTSKVASATMVFSSNHSCGPTGKWVNVNNRYLGLRFLIQGKTHYGWARLSVQVKDESEITATLTGYAYETVPKQSIRAGQTHGTDGSEDGGNAETSSSNETRNGAEILPPTSSLGMLARGIHTGAFRGQR
jgi:hypothetical protein